MQKEIRGIRGNELSFNSLGKLVQMRAARKVSWRHQGNKRTWLDNLQCYFKQFIILKAYLGVIKSKFFKIIHMDSFQTCDIKHVIDTLQPNTNQHDFAEKQKCSFSTWYSTERYYKAYVYAEVMTSNWLISEITTHSWEQQ